MNTSHILFIAIFCIAMCCFSKKQLCAEEQPASQSNGNPDFATRIKHPPLIVYAGNASDFAFSSDSKSLVFSAGGKVLILDNQTHKINSPLPEGTTQYLMASLSPDQKWILTGDTDFRVALHEAKTGKQVKKLGLFKDQPNHAVFSPSGEFAAAIAGRQESELAIWDLLDATHQINLRGPQATLNDLQFSPDGQSMAAASGDGAVIVWDTTGWKWKVRRGAWIATNGGVTSIAFSPHGQKLAAAAGWEHQITFLDILTGKVTGYIDTGRQSLFHHIAFSPDGRVIALSNGGTQIRFWDPSTLAPSGLLDCAGNAFRIGFSSDGRFLAAITAKGLLLWSIADKTQQVPDKRL
ncbi:MAG: WD40 repeat domain-containing protein [Prosthecobacter sp.]|nr:WD40 repeat domain-containing protein [Prosthecobacter sp.]